jgi:hypothetical protein
MKRLTLLLALTICVLGAGFAQAQSEPETPPTWVPRTDGFGVAAMFNIPNDEFGKRTDNGFGIHGVWVKPLIPLISLTADVGFNHFPSSDNGQPEANVWEFTGGLRFEFGAFYMGGEGGYYTEIDEGSFIPSMGLRFGKFEFAGRWKAVGGSSWTGLRLTYFF